MEMEGRTASSLNYRYGFNGKEKDASGEFSASQTHYDYGFRIYNPVWGKFLSVDPLTGSYAMLTPYQFASNRPIDGVDLDGLEWNQATHEHPPILPVLGGTVRAGWNNLTYSIWRNHQIIYGGKSETDIPYRNYFVSDNGGNIEIGYTEQKVEPPLSTKLLNNLVAGIDVTSMFPSSQGVSLMAHAPFVLNGGQTARWVAESIKGWSKAAIDYQELVTGVKAGSTLQLDAYWRVSGKVSFDGIKNGVLLEAKSSYDNFVKASGEFKAWFRGAEGLLSQARDQIKAANGTAIEWHFKAEKTYLATKKLFEKEGIEGINLIFNPIN
jgi:RHS repeat-associated protein